MPSFGFCGPTYQTRSRNVGIERCINLFPEFSEQGNPKSRIALYGTPGLHTLCTLPTSPVRGLYSDDGRNFAVAGNALYEIYHNGTFALRGNVNNSPLPAYLYPNGTQLFIISGDEGFLDTGTEVNKVVDARFGAYLDGYFLILKPNTNEIYCSALMDGQTWDPLDFRTRMSTPDRVVAIWAHNGALWLFGHKRTSPWYNSGDADFPFTPIQGAELDMGALPYTIRPVDKSLCFVGSDENGANVVWRTVGYQVQRISNHAVEAGLADMPANAFPTAYVYQEGGHTFYVLQAWGSAPGESNVSHAWTWVYDFSTNMWHERARWTGAAWAEDAGACHSHSYLGYHLIGSANSGKIWMQSQAFGDVDGVPIRRYRQAPHLSSEQKWSFYHSLQIDLEQGTQWSGVPTAKLKWSDDGGYTWTAEKPVTLGAANNYSKRAIWRRLGRSRDRVFGVTLEGIDGQTAIVDAYLKASAGNGA